MLLKRINDLSVKVHAEAPLGMPHSIDRAPGQKLGKLPESYWSMVAAGPGAMPVSATPPLRLPAGIQIAPVAAKGAAAVQAGTLTNNGPLALRHISEAQANVLAGAWQALKGYNSPQALMHSIETSTAQRNVLLTVGTPAVNGKVVNSAAFDRPGNAGAKQRVLLLNQALVANRNGGPSQRLVSELYDLLLKEQASLGVATDKTVLKVGKQEIFFKHELDLNRRRDEFQHELGDVSHYESDYVTQLRDELISRGAWRIHKPAVLAAVSPELQARFAEVPIKGRDLTLGEVIDHLEALHAEGAGKTVDVDGVELTANDFIGGLDFGLKNKLFSTQDVMRELQRPHLADPDAREVLRAELSKKF